MLKGKAWGSTETLFDHPLFTVHRLLIVPDSRCSFHYHRRKFNGFMVLDGELVIEEDMGRHYGDIGGPYDHVDRTVLRPGQFMAVRPGVTHRFVNESGRDVLAMECYWPDILGEDIARLDVGGVMEAHT